MWEKGEAISAEFRGVESAPSYRQLTIRKGEMIDVTFRGVKVTFVEQQASQEL